MKTFRVSTPELAFVAATRGMAGAGVGLLVADCFRSTDTRRAVGWALLAIGALTTIPIALAVVGRRRQLALHGPDENHRLDSAT